MSKGKLPVRVMPPDIEAVFSYVCRRYLDEKIDVALIALAGPTGTESNAATSEAARWLP